MRKRLKISIITVVYNGVEHIDQAMQSVLGQEFSDDIALEYIVIDGGSTDGTVKLIENHEKSLAYYVSESDSGIYNAMNKGIAKATGDIIGILNADDFYIDKQVLQGVADAFKDDPAIEVVYGDLNYVDAVNTKRIVRSWRSRMYKDGLFKKGWHPAHPTLFVGKEVYEKYGDFDEQFKIAADYDFMLRIFEKHKVQSKYMPSTFVNMRIGGASNNSVKSIIKANIESYKSWRKNDFSIGMGLSAVTRKPLSKLAQFFKRA